jgi:cytochrome P450
MTTLEHDLANPTGCPVTHHTSLNRDWTPAGWHAANFDLQRELAPIHTGLANGHQFYMATRMDDIRRSFQTAEVFSNTAVTPGEPDPPYRWIPEMLDGKYHLYWRQMLGPLWSPPAIDKLRPRLLQRFTEVLDAVADKGECEFVNDVALLFPNVMFMDLMGLPRADAAQFQAWEVAILHGGVGPERDQQRMDAMMAVIGYFMGLIAERRKEPRDDMLSYVLAAKLDDGPIPEQDILDFCLLMFMAGLDTVANQLTYNFWHLATHDDDRRRIVDDPSMIPGAVEEFLRYYSFVTPSRKVLSDTEIAGCPVPAGHMVFLPLVAANRDPREFGPDANEVKIDRGVNRHIAFGAGPHRCLGSHLARAELYIAMEEWHKRIPNYRIAPGTEVLEHGGQYGIEQLHLVWDR